MGMISSKESSEGAAYHQGEMQSQAAQDSANALVETQQTQQISLEDAALLQNQTPSRNRRSMPPTPDKPMRAPMQQQRSAPRMSASQPTNFNDDDDVDVSETPLQTEPEPDLSSSGPLSIQTRIEYSALPTRHTQDVFGLVTVQAASVPEPASGADAEAERQPMDIVCVLDVSGSMQGDKIRQVQGAQRFIIEQADPKDRLSIVSFNQQANRVLRLRKMSAEGKNEATVSTLQLNAGGGTSIAAGLETALAVMEQRRQRNKVSAIMLLTDGQDGSTRHRLPELMQRAARANCAIYAFGFGRDHDAALLSEIAERAQTPFTFVEETDKIREAFAGTLGGLTSIVAQRVELTLKCKVPLKTLHTSFAVLRPSDQEAVVTIPDMFAQERRDILVELAVPADSSGPGHRVLLEASAKYVDLRRNCFAETLAAIMEAQCVEEPQPEAEPDAEVSAQRERVEVTRALESAAAASDAGNFQSAIQVIDQAEQRMKASKRTTPASAALGQELLDARNRMNSRSAWEQGGRAEVKDATQMHKMQRCTMLTQSASSPQKMSRQMYCSPMQSAMISKSNGNA